MAKTNDFSVACTEMDAHVASVVYAGNMCQAGAMALVHQFERLFGYYKYTQIVLSMESPGGSIDGMEHVLRAMDRFTKEGKSVAVQSTFQCASAAAFILAMGQWGSRRVDRGTFLLFHSARIDGSAMPGMTASYSSQLSQALTSLDHKLIDVLVGRMLAETGGPDNLIDLVLARICLVDLNWKQLAADVSTLTQVVDGSRKPDWLKALQKLTRHACDERKFVLELKKLLGQRMQRDARMDVCEAYALCLIDEIDGVLDAATADPVWEPEALDPELVDVVRSVEFNEVHPSQKHA